MNIGNYFGSIGCLNNHVNPNTFQTHFDKPTCGKHRNNSHLKCQQHTSIGRNVLRKYKELYDYLKVVATKVNFGVMSQF